MGICSAIHVTADLAMRAEGKHAGISFQILLEFGGNADSVTPSVVWQLLLAFQPAAGAKLMLSDNSESSIDD